ncbi:hypothetical protein L207DRAFT_525529 [Hyaloscypha variabilis F]|uniref:Uncharacterized protein n=1 Tax=Hyaloscypha variabilis (strain UAMH 11265 / GT02V1 / F) TaxID=1149755 RepID=A0A2J6S082_HYAVF|nr:hypothetical protein L207DRAFT_525529 [Hyaloscypha variabilis F]
MWVLRWLLRAAERTIAAAEYSHNTCGGSAGVTVLDRRIAALPSTASNKHANSIGRISDIAKLRADNGRYGPSTYRRDMHIWLRPVAANYAIGNVTHDIATLPVMVRELYRRRRLSVSVRAISGCESMADDQSAGRGRSKETRQDLCNLFGRPVTVLRMALDLSLGWPDWAWRGPFTAILASRQPLSTQTSSQGNSDGTKSLISALHSPGQAKSWMCSRAELILQMSNRSARKDRETWRLDGDLAKRRRTLSTMEQHPSCLEDP